MIVCEAHDTIFAALRDIEEVRLSSLKRTIVEMFLRVSDQNTKIISTRLISEYLLLIFLKRHNGRYESDLKHFERLTKN